MIVRRSQDGIIFGNKMLSPCFYLFIFPEAASSGHKPKRRAHLLRRRGLSGTGFFDGSKKDGKGKQMAGGGEKLQGDLSYDPSNDDGS